MQSKIINGNWCKQRLIFSIFFVLVSFSCLVLRLFFLQILEGEKYRQYSENNCIRIQNLEASRGLIFDRNGNLLADNRPSFDLCIIPRNAKPIKQTLAKLATYLNTPVSEFLDKIEKNKDIPLHKPIILRQDVEREILAKVEVRKFDLPGVFINIRSKRHYPEKETAAHLIGYIGEINLEELKSEKYPDYKTGDIIGKFGVEKSLEDFLRGTRGGQQIEVNAMGQVIRILSTIDPQPGHNVYLTIDKTLQEKAEEIIKSSIGAIVMIETRTGEVLAMASSPSFDPNNFIDGLSGDEWNKLISDKSRPMEDKAIQAEYPPASTYKIITAIAGLEEKIINEGTTFYCPGFYEFGNRTFQCWKKSGHGSINVVGALAESCDVYFYQVGQRLGVDKLAEYAKAFGLGAPTGIDLEHEASGLIPTSAWKKRYLGTVWQKGETLSLSIGQGYNLATPIQMAVVTATVANGGTLFVPRIVKKVETADGKENIEITTKIRNKLKISKRTLDIVKRGLWSVVNSNGGTAKIARLYENEISGKTGTAQVVGRKKNDNSRDEAKLATHLRPHAWFVAYDAAGPHQVAVAVIVENGEHGGSTAAPLARDLIEFHFNLRQENKDTQDNQNNKKYLEKQKNQEKSKKEKEEEEKEEE